MIKQIFRLLLSLIILLLVNACSQNREVLDKLELAESLINNKPDSSLLILESLPKNKINTKEERARYGLLMSMAIDKNYIDTTTFEILQPAIDYYLKKGSSNEKLLTYYYQGRIYQNIGVEEDAMNSFVKALDLKNLATDSLTLAHLLVAQAIIYHNQYKIKEYINNNLEASDIYKKIGKINLQIKSLTNALNGSIVEGNKPSADSLMIKCVHLFQQYGFGESYLFSSTLAYLLKFGTQEELENFLETYKNRDLNEDDAINYALGYSKIGRNDKALEFLSKIENSRSILDSLKFASVKVEIFSNIGNYKEALDEYKIFTSLVEKNQYNLLSKDLLFVEKRHELEKANILKVQRKNNVIWLILTIVFALIIILSVIYYRYKLGKAKNRLINEEKTILQLEKENLIMQVNRLEEESYSLKEIIEKQKDIAQPIKEVLKNRLIILNGLLAKEITNNESYAISYNKWIETIRKDKKEFMDSNSMAFSASHPEFIKYLEERGLTKDEINYSCLYALGLRGKEVGEYIQLKRHYNISSAIRKKLNIDEHETNIGIYIRKLMEEFGR